jgi:hypothetical protein
VHQRNQVGRRGIVPAALELLDTPIIEAVEKRSSLASLSTPGPC